MSHVGIAAASLVAGVQAAPSTALIPFTEEEKAAAAPMEPALVALLRQGNIREEVIWKFRINTLCDRDLFVSIDRDEDALRKTLEKDFGLDPRRASPTSSKLEKSRRHGTLQKSKAM